MRFISALLLLVVALLPLNNALAKDDGTAASAGSAASGIVAGAHQDEPGAYGEVQFNAANVDSFHLIFGYESMLDYNLMPASGGEVVRLDRPYTRAVVIARGFHDKEVSLPRSRDSQSVVEFTMSEIEPGRIAETRYPMIHWDANLFLVAEPGTRFELDQEPLQKSATSSSMHTDLQSTALPDSNSGSQSDTTVYTNTAIHRMEYRNENTLLLRMWPGTYSVTAHYPDGRSWSEEIRLDFDRLRYQPMYQNPLESDLQRARWIPGGGQSLKREYGKATAIQALMVASLTGSAITWAGYFMQRDRYHDSYNAYRQAPAFSDFDALYSDVQRHQRTANLYSAMRYVLAATLAGTYIYNVIDGGSEPATGFREYRGIDPFLDMDQHTGAPTVGIRYSRN